MKRNKKYVRLILLWIMLCMCSLPVHAKVTVLKSTSLKNVTKAKTVEGEWKKKGNHYRFRQTDGTYRKNGWFRADGKVYYVDARGNRVKGWVKYRNQLYYLNSKGALKTGWLEKGQKRYYLKKNGCAARGLYSVEEDTYYFDKNTGAAVSGWVRVGKKNCYFDKKTFLQKKSAWVKTGGKYYYVDADGYKRGQGWLKLNGKKYYLDASGARVTGTVYIGKNGKGYYFKKNGVYDPSVKVKPEVDAKKPMVALTFDDGPGIYTDRLLNCLKKNNARATFFMVGSNVSRYKATVKKMAQMGCELGNHSYSHANLVNLSNSAIASEIARTSSNIKSASGSNPTLVRLPYGNGHSSSRVLSAVGLPSIYWSIDTRDWANTGNPGHTVSEVLNHVRNGDIVLMHDIHYSTIVAAERIIPELKRRGYQLVTVSQLAKYKGKTTLQSGRTYYSFR